MKSALLHIVLCAFIFFSLSARTPAQNTQGSYLMPMDQIIPDRPWTMFVPDPDRFDWTARDGGRPGYRYRGMLPMQQRFYDYIQQKRRNNVPLSEADQATIRWLISSRRWPEAPRPNAFWAAFMRYLREQPTTDLNIAQSIMLDQLRSRGFVPIDVPPDPDFARVRDYLNSEPFRSRNWFERTFGRVEPWMDNLYAGWGYDMRPGAPSGSSSNSFPTGDPFNGLKINYSVAGATLSPPVDTYGFTITRGHKGVLGTGTLTISGTVRVGGYGAGVSLSVWAGDKKDEKRFSIENKGDNGNPQNFSLSVPIPADARTGGFAIRLDGQYSAGHRGCYVTGEFSPSQAQIDADRAAADAKWRQEVENTLRRLGYEDTPEGREIAEMRQALAGGDAAWEAFVDKRLAQMQGDTSPQMAEYKELENAMAAGGAEWDKYVAVHGTPSSTKTSGNLATASSLVKQGQVYYEKNQYDQAVGAFTKAIEANPKSAEAYAGRGLAKRSLRDYAAASADFNRAIALDPRNSEAYRGRSMVKRAQNDFSGALADANRAVELAPNFDRAYLTRGLAREGLKDLAGALSDYSRAISLDPSYAMSHFYRAHVRFDSKDYAGAVGDYDRYIEMNAKNSAAFNNRGLAKERLNDSVGAAADYEKAVALDPKDETAKKNLARLREAIAATQSGPPTLGGSTQGTTTTPSGHPHVVVAADGNFQPAPGYRWVNDAPGDLRVIWSPGKPHPQHPNVVAGATEGRMEPAPGYRWVNDAPGDLRVVPKDRGADVATVPETGRDISSCAQEVVLYTNNNIAGVQNGPTQLTHFQLNEPTLVTYLMSYHWNNGRGQPPGTIVLRHQDGTTYGGAAGSAPGSGGVPNAYWIVRPNVVLKSGIYTVVDSHPGTWAQNAQSNGQGIVEVKGCSGGMLAAMPGAVATAAPPSRVAEPPARAGSSGKGSREGGDLTSRSGGSTPGNLALGKLAGTKAVYKSTLADVYMTASFTGTGVSVVCQSPDGQGRRTFDGGLTPRPGRPDVVAGQAPYQGETPGGVEFSFDTGGEWANVLWSPKGRDVQWTRWVRVNAVGQGGQR